MEPKVTVFRVKGFLTEGEFERLSRAIKVTPQLRGHTFAVIEGDSEYYWGKAGIETLRECHDSLHKHAQNLGFQFE